MPSRGRPPHHLVSGRFPRKRWIMDSTNGEARPGEAERPYESGAASPGRGGRMSRQRKTAAVLRLLRGEDLETVSRSVGVTAATLSGWRDAFLAAGDGSLATKPASGEELENERLKAKLGAALIERDLLQEKIAILEANALWPDGGTGTGHEPRHVAGDRQVLWARHGLPGLAARALWGLPPPVAYTYRLASPSWTDRRDDRCCADGGDPRRARRQPFSRRGPSQGLGQAAPTDHFRVSGEARAVTM